MCLADALSHIDAGRYTPDGSLDGITVTCWNNTAEFADKTAQEYESAKERLESLPKASQTVVGNDIVPNYMDHAYYSPQTGINRLLRPYFPEQPGDTPLIDSPVGRFISTVTEMWLHGGGRKLHIKNIIIPRYPTAFLAVCCPATVRLMHTHIIKHILMLRTRRAWRRS